MKKVGLVVKVSNPEAIKLADEIAGWVTERGGEVFADRTLAGMVRLGLAGVPVNIVAPEKFPDSIELLIVLGGDGTMLHAARLLDGRKVPILGVNLGSLGFLTAITVKEVFPLLERIFRGDCVVEERMTLSVELKRKDGGVMKHTVLNDAVIKGEAARLVRLETRINMEYVNTYRADGLIVATPTGSTAYSLSANGPILYPTIHSIIVAPICPFNLTNRPVVIPDWMTVDVTVSPDQANVELILDGQVEVPLESGDMVRIKRAQASVYLIKYEGKSYFDILRERLMWEVKTNRSGKA
ncbi:MAG: NAD(+)/NADH kinase [Deltaproteobacteria bacterium]|nr:NAD(+)/NADH kinase [Deltaproteobacteria bacterium]